MINKKAITFLLLGLTVIAAVIAGIHYFSGRSGSAERAFRYDLEPFRQVNDSLLLYREFRQIRIGEEAARDLAWGNGRIYLLTETSLVAISTGGEELFRMAVSGEPQRLEITPEGNLLLAFDNHLVMYNETGDELQRSTEAGEEVYFVSVAAAANKIFVADAGTRQVRVFNPRLEETHAFRGESGVSEHHGFILPDMHFDLAVNHADELWVSNPGLHLLQHYSSEGRLRRYWGKASFDLEGFSGCCNPSYFSFLSDGSVVTSEKGLVRLKQHHPSGSFTGVVAPATAFGSSNQAPALAVDENDNVLALDFDRNMIRLFKKESPFNE